MQHSLITTQPQPNYFSDFDKKETTVYGGSFAIAKNIRALRNIDVPVHVFEKKLGIRDLVRHFVGGDQEDAFFVCNLSTIVDQHTRWTANFPRVEPFYAVKCNPSPTMIRVLANLGCGFDCASATEIDLVKSLGVVSESVIFAHPCKQLSHLRHARDVGVNLTVFDNGDELLKIKRNHPNARLLLRIVTNDTSAACPFSKKFGALPSACPSLFEMARELGLCVVGISLHVGSGQTMVVPFLKSVVDAHGVFEMGRKYGFSMSILDIGGGFPGSCSDPSFEDIAGPMSQKIDELFDSSVRVIAEPGRFFAESSHVLSTCVIGRRDIAHGGNAPPSGPDPSPGTNDTTCDCDYESEESTIEIEETTGDLDYLYYINDGVYGSFNCLFYDHASCTPHVLKEEHLPKKPCKIFGPTCDALDCVVQSARLPVLDVGDWVYFNDMGAYTKAAASTFNGFNRSETHCVWC